MKKKFIRRICDGDCLHCVYDDCMIDAVNDEEVEKYTGGVKIDYCLLENVGKRENNRRKGKAEGI